MFQEIIPFIGLCCFDVAVASHPVFAHSRICTPVGTLTSGGEISPELVSLPVLTQFSTIFSKTSSGTVISTAGPLNALSFRHVFPTVLNQKVPPFAGKS